MNTKKGKIIIISAPSGTGKSTIIKTLTPRTDLRLGFSISATSRKPRDGETDGKEYYFITVDEFKNRIANDDFVEWEEVYEGNFYGTLKSEIERVINEGRNLIMDIDVKGAINVKRIYAEDALALFIAPPSLEALSERLITRGTDSKENIEKRLQKADYEMSFAPKFDKIIINDDLATAQEETYKTILNFINH